MIRSFLPQPFTLEKSLCALSRLPVGGFSYGSIKRAFTPEVPGATLFHLRSYSKIFYSESGVKRNFRPRAMCACTCFVVTELPRPPVPLTSTPIAGSCSLCAKARSACASAQGGARGGRAEECSKSCGEKSSVAQVRLAPSCDQCKWCMLTAWWRLFAWASMLQSSCGRSCSVWAGAPRETSRTCWESYRTREHAQGKKWRLSGDE